MDLNILSFALNDFHYIDLDSFDADSDSPTKLCLEVYNKLHHLNLDWLNQKTQISQRMSLFAELSFLLTTHQCCTVLMIQSSMQSWRNPDSPLTSVRKLAGTLSRWSYGLSDALTSAVTLYMIVSAYIATSKGAMLELRDSILPKL